MSIRVHPWLLLLCLLLATGCAKREAAPATSATPQVLRISQRNEPADLDPATATLPDEFFIIRALSEGLVAPDPKGGQRAAAAERWDVSADGLTYTFHLRRDGTWSNGELVVASDFVESYRRLLAPSTAATKAPLFYAVKNARAFASGELTDFNAVGFQAAAPHQLIVTLEHPTPAFLAYVASGPWIPTNPRVVARHGRGWTRPGNFVGNGPFTLSAWRPNQRIVVRKNPGYVEAARIRVDEIHFVAFDDGDAEERAYRARQVDITMSVPISKVATYVAERPAELRRTSLAETRYLSFNTQRAPLNDVRVRQALSAAIDRRKITERVLLGGQHPADQLLPEAMIAMPNRDPALTAGPFMPDLARHLLAQAGFPGGKNFPRLELSGWTNKPVLEAIQAMWRHELGIDVTIVTREAKVHVDDLRSARYDIGFIISSPDVADALNILREFTTGAPGNYPHWSDATYDALIAEASRTVEPARHWALIHRASSRLRELQPAAPLYFNTRNSLVHPRVRGWQEDPFWTRFYHDVYLDNP